MLKQLMKTQCFSTSSDMTDSKTTAQAAGILLISKGLYAYIRLIVLLPQRVCLLHVMVKRAREDCDEEGHNRCFMYQSHWTEDFRAKSDVEFVVEESIFPVHSLFFFQSKILQSCLSDTEGTGKSRLESCFKNIRKTTVDQLLCQIYPGDNDLSDLSAGDLMRLVSLAALLDCPTVILYAKRALEKNRYKIKLELKKEGLLDVHKWITISEQTYSETVKEVVLEFLVEHFEQHIDRSPENGWNGFLQALPFDMLEEFMGKLQESHRKEKDELLGERISMYLECGACGDKVCKLGTNLDDLGRAQKRIKVREYWRCKLCGGERRSYLVEAS